MVKSAAQMERLSIIIGKEVWFRTPDHDMNRGIANNITPAGLIRIRILHGSVLVSPKDIFRTKADLISANYETFSAKVDEYCKEIDSVEDLVKFCYNHPVAKVGGYTDWAARSAVSKMTDKLLGFEIEDETAILKDLYGEDYERIK